jgi:hypothetical protein
LTRLYEKYVYDHSRFTKAVDQTARRREVKSPGVSLESASCPSTVRPIISS